MRQLRPSGRARVQAWRRDLRGIGATGAERRVSPVWTGQNTEPLGAARRGIGGASIEVMNELISVLLQDKSIQAIIKSAKSQEEVVKALLAAAIKKDITVTEAELTKVLAAVQAKPRTAKLTDQELLGVTGGMMASGGDTTKRGPWCLCNTKRINDTNC